MNYWVTTQWPHSIEDDKGQEHSGVYVPNDRQAAVDKMNCGDIVFIYESQSGRVIVENLEDGSRKETPCHIGRMEILDIVEVVAIHKRKDLKTTQYTNGTSIWWQFHAETKSVYKGGRVSRNKLNDILGYNRNYNLRGFGDQHSGIKKITKEQALALTDEYNSNKK